MMIAPLCVRTIEFVEAYIGKLPRVSGSQVAPPSRGRVLN
jgi:hypothetical protein